MAQSVFGFLLFGAKQALPPVSRKHHKTGKSVSLVELLLLVLFKKKIPVKEGHILIVQYAEQILFVKRDLRKIWGGLWSLPELEKKDDLDQWLLKFLKINLAVLV